MFSSNWGAWIIQPSFWPNSLRKARAAVVEFAFWTCSSQCIITRIFPGRCVLFEAKTNFWFYWVCSNCASAHAVWRRGIQFLVSGQCQSIPKGINSGHLLLDLIGDYILMGVYRGAVVSHCRDSSLRFVELLAFTSLPDYTSYKFHVWVPSMALRGMLFFSLNRPKSFSFSVACIVQTGV